LVLLPLSIVDFNTTKLVFHCDNSQLVTFGESFYSKKGVIDGNSEDDEDSKKIIKLRVCDYFTAGERFWVFLSGSRLVLSLLSYVYSKKINNNTIANERVKNDHQYLLDYAPDVTLLPMQSINLYTNKITDLIPLYFIKDDNGNRFRFIYRIRNSEDSIFLSIVNRKR